LRVPGRRHDALAHLGKAAAVLALLSSIAAAILAALHPRASLVAENLALRQQLAVLRRAAPRPRLRPVDRAFWVVLSRMWSRWAETVVIVKPETVIGWHRRGFVSFWARRSRCAGRPSLDPVIVELIVRMARENPTWSRRRIASELAKLGHAVSKDTVARYIPRRRPRSRPPSQTWGTFIRNHLPGTLAIDFLTVPTATFGVLYVFFVLSLERRRVLHVNVTAHPYAAWAAQQMIEAVAPDVVAERVIRDRDRIFGAVFDKRVIGMGLEQFRIAPHAPWQNGFAERFVGTTRRELLDHVIVLGERHLLRLVRDYVRFYNDDRPHMALDGDAPAGRAIEGPAQGEVIALSRVGGLHHRYTRAA
jgi:transposase InsO family protein